MLIKQRREPGGQVPLAAGFLASILSVACCVGPLLLVSLGFGGAWASRLAALDPWRPWFVALSLLFLGWGVWSAFFRKSRSCTTGSFCAKPVKRTYRLLWSILLLSFLLLTFPWYASWLFHE
ncbi:MAG: mercuric transporter MerT family protein [Nitrospiraceae bacterium]|nr:mercuric transporter MerT family protein [Nitrospiraceae bacterium]